MTSGTGRIYVGFLEMSNNPIGRLERKIEMRGSAMRKKVLKKLVGIYVDGIEICYIPEGREDGGL